MNACPVSFNLNPGKSGQFLGLQDLLKLFHVSLQVAFGPDDKMGLGHWRMGEGITIITNNKNGC
jgi:hypothetical protein